MIGSTIGKYRIVSQLGRGGMGTVYRAVDETLDREVAIKMLNGDLLSPESLQRFRAEAVTLARLNHPRIASIHELAREGHDLLMVMEYIAGETCEKMMARLGPLPIPRAVLLCDQVLDALQHAHAAGIVHRDLKPANVMLTASGDIKVMDFGIARVAGTEHLTSDGYMMGTPAYMAPEQVRGEEVDQRMDLYSAAVLLYRLLTKHLPFEADSAIALIHSQLTNPPTPPRQFRADLPDWIETIVLRGLAKSPSDRFQTAAEFRRALEDGLGGAPVKPALRTWPDDDQETVGVTPSPTVVEPTVLESIATPSSGPASTTTRKDATVTLRTPHLVAAGTVLAILIGGLVVLAYVALRKPAVPVATMTATPATSTIPAPPATPDAPGVSDSASAASSGPVPTAPPGPTPPAGVSTSATAAKTGRASLPPRPGVTTPPSTVPPVAAPPVSSAPPPPPVENTAAQGEATKDPPAQPVHPTQSFGDVKAVVADGTKTREIDVLLGLEPDRAVLRSRDNGTVIQSIAYRSIAAATYARAKRPRGNEDVALAQVPKDFGGSGFFLKTSKHWLTLQSASSFVVLRLEDKNVMTVLASIESRTGNKVARPANND
jgi:eukaryotic-like serine/threonine-protein kinase